MNLFMLAHVQVSQYPVLGWVGNPFAPLVLCFFTYNLSASSFLSHLLRVWQDYRASFLAQLQ